VKELQDVNDWLTFGIYRGIKMPTMEAIRRDYPTTGERRTQMLYEWQKNVIPTWSAVVQALVGIGMRRLASELAQKHGQLVTLSQVCSIMYMGVGRCFRLGGPIFTVLWVLPQMCQHSVYMQ